MDTFETFEIINYGSNNAVGDEKLTVRIFRSKAFKVFLCVFALSVFVAVGFVIYNDITVRDIDFGNQSFVFVNQMESETMTSSVIAEDSDGRININTATVQELMSLQGIGHGRATAIIEYRNENGRFMSAEEIMRVDSIGEGLYYSIKDYITVE